MDSENENSEDKCSSNVAETVANIICEGGVAVAHLTGKTVGFSGKLFRAVVDKASNLSVPSMPGTDKVKGLFSGGILKSWGGETSSIKIKIAKTKERIDNLYSEIGKRGARLSGVEDITEHESVKELVNEVKTFEAQIQRWEERIKEIAKERELSSQKRKAKSKDVKGGSNASIKNKILNSINQAIKVAEFDESSQKAVFDKVTHDLLDDDLEIRLLAAAELGKMENKAAIPVLTNALLYKDDYLSSEVLNALININDSSCLDIFVKHIKDKNHRIRLGSLRGIYKTGGEKALPYLTDALKDEHAEVRKSAATFLGWVGLSDSVSALIQTLKDSDAEVKKAAAMSLSILRDPSSIMPLIRSLSDSDIELREKIVHAIERITGKSIEFKIDASGKKLKESIDDLKEWWQKEKLSDIDAEIKGQDIEEAKTEVEEEDNTVEEPAAEEPVETEAEPEVTESQEETSKEEVVEESAQEESVVEENSSEPEDAVSEEVEETAEEEVSEQSLQKLLKKDLISRCEELNIDLTQDETKADLIKKILEKCQN